MLKVLFALYFTSYFCYIFYTREPDYFDGETTTATISKINNSLSATYFVNNKLYHLDINYPFRNYIQGEKVTVIYHSSKPQNAAVYSIWGYWFKWQELLLSFILLFGLYQLAVSITLHPQEEKS